MRRFIESGPKIEEIFPKMFPKECEVCKRKDNLLRCGGCSVYWYCGREHQVSDRSTHKGTCNQIKGARTKVETLESKLRADAPEYLEAYAGRLWMFQPARDYLTAVANYGELLVRSWRRQGIEDALEVYLKILQLNRGDNQGVRDLIPALYIRLGRDQEAYDFLKYWGLQFNNKLDKEQPFLGVKRADAFEDVELWTGKSLYLTHAVSVLLIKIRLLIGIQSVQRMKAWKASKGEDVAAMSGAEVLDWLRDDLRPFCGDIFERAPEVLGDDALLEQTLSEVVDRISALFQAINRYNKYYLATLLNPEESDFESEVVGYTLGSEEEAKLAFKRTYSAWCETEGAIKGLRNMISNGLAE
ncbi:hypothetical protein N657DRAFT_566773 [Parathielavia appendiculata]|uniref:MYND-type domain-containing protein n=1 Tax=Parathielavia appendiculata TaxID=2587402 RepID=A0AAN6U8C7_9PEZI|nr:hypothetical protein N657DRAFT_566773 [Parathielavia appendiculata]